MVLFSHIGCMFVCMCACVCEFSLCVGMCFSTSCVLAILCNMVSVRGASLFLCISVARTDSLVSNTSDADLS